MKKVLIIFISLLIMFSFSLLWAQDEVNGQDPDDMRSYEKQELTSSKTTIINGQIIEQKPVVLKTQKAFTLRERNKLAEIEKARLAAPKNVVSTVRTTPNDKPRGMVSTTTE